METRCALTAVNSTCHMTQVSVFTSSFFLPTLILGGIRYYLEALGNLWNGNEIPKSNLQFHDKLHWHSDAFRSLTAQKKQRSRWTGRLPSVLCKTPVSSHFDFFKCSNLFCCENAAANSLVGASVIWGFYESGNLTPICSGSEMPRGYEQINILTVH